MQRYFAKEKKDDVIALEPADEHHIRHVMRMQKGDFIEAVYEGKLYQAEIVDLDNIKIKIVKELVTERAPGPNIALIIPTLKEPKMDLILQKGTEMGVSGFYVVPFSRSVVSIDERKAKVKLERWQKICKEASEQSLRVDIPFICLEKDMSFTKELTGLKLICSTNEKKKSIKSALKNAYSYDKIILVVGPEGGITPNEEANLEEMGFTKVSLGQQIMRVETVPLFLTSVIKYEFME